MIDNVLNIEENEIAVLVGELVFTYEVDLNGFELFDNSDDFETWVDDNREVIKFKLVSVELDDEVFTGEYIEPSRELLENEIVEWVKKQSEKCEYWEV